MCRAETLAKYIAGYLSDFVAFERHKGIAVAGSVPWKERFNK